MGLQCILTSSQLLGKTNVWGTWLCELEAVVWLKVIKNGFKPQSINIVKLLNTEVFKKKWSPHLCEKVQVVICEQCRWRPACTSPQFWSRTTVFTYYLHRLVRTFLWHLSVYFADAHDNLNIHCSEMPTCTFFHRTGSFMLPATVLHRNNYQCNCYWCTFKSFPSCIRMLKQLQQSNFRKCMVKGNIAHNEQSLLLPQCFQLCSLIIVSFLDNIHMLTVMVFQNCLLQICCIYK